MKPVLMQGGGPAVQRIDLLPIVARALGTSTSGAAVALRGPLSLARQCARVIAALKAAGAEEELVQFIQPIDLAIQEAEPTVSDGEDLELPSDGEDSQGVPARDVAQGYLNRLYEKIHKATRASSTSW